MSAFCCSGVVRSWLSFSVLHSVSLRDFHRVEESSRKSACRCLNSKFGSQCESYVGMCAPFAFFSWCRGGWLWFILFFFPEAREERGEDLLLWIKEERVIVDVRG